MIVPFFCARVTCSRGKRNGEAQWQKDHLNAKDAKRGARRNGHDSIVLRWQNDEKYRESQKVHGWTEEFCRDLDYLTTIDISYSAWHQRNHYENTIFLVSHDDDRQAGPMRARKDFQSTTQNLTDLRQEQGRKNSCIPKNERARQTPFDEALRADLEWHSQNWKTYSSQTSSSSSSQQLWQHEHQDTQLARTPGHSMARIFCFTDFAYRH